MPVLFGEVQEKEYQRTMMAPSLGSRGKDSVDLYEAIMKDVEPLLADPKITSKKLMSKFNAVAKENLKGMARTPVAQDAKAMVNRFIEKFKTSPEVKQLEAKEEKERLAKLAKQQAIERAKQAMGKQARRMTRKSAKKNRV